MPDTVNLLAAVGVAAGFVALAFSVAAARLSTLRGWPASTTVILAFPVLSIVGFFIALFGAFKDLPESVKARGGGLTKAGADGAFSPGGFIATSVIAIGGCVAAFFVGSEVMGLSGETLQRPLIYALVIGGLVGGVVCGVISRRVSFLEASWVAALTIALPALFHKATMSAFTYGTAPAYYAVVLVAGGLVLLLCLTLGGSFGYLFCGDGEVVTSWSWESFIGRRFLMGKRGNSVVGTITVISVLAVGVGTCAMVVVMSVMNGFSSDLRSKIFGANAHLLVMKYGTDFTEYPEVIAKSKALPGITGATPFVLGEVMVSSETQVTGALMKGIDLATVDTVTVIRSNVTKGALEHLDTPEKIPTISKPTLEPGEPPPPGEAPPVPGDLKGPPVPGAAGGDAAAGDVRPPGGPEGTSERQALDDAIAAAAAGVGQNPAAGETKNLLPGIAIGAEMAKSLRVFVGDVINVMSPIGELGPTGPIPKGRAYRVAAVFYSGMYEYDSKFVYISLAQAQDFMGLRGGVTGVEYKVDDIEATQGTARAVLKAIGGYPYRTKDWMEMNRNLFSALKLEKIAMFIILTFIIIVASFLIAATLIVFVIEKSKEIAILKTMGATDTSIMKVFITYGVAVGVMGTVTGLAAGLLLCLGIKTFGIGLDPDVYYITHLPVAVEPFEVGLVAVAAVVLSYLATIYPALLAARMRPVEGLRYE